MTALALPASAVAQDSSPSQDQYDSNLSQVSGGDESASASGAADEGLGADVGPLPFTGYDLILMVAVALGIVGLGVAFRRLATRRSGPGVT